MTDVEIEIADGMRRLLARRAAEVANGAEPIGWKIGINAPAIQAHFGLDGSIVGYLTTATMLAPGALIDVSHLRAPALEVEVAVRVADDGGVEAVAPALELVDLGAGFDGITSILAGNILHRGVVFGSWRTGSITLPLDVDVRVGDAIVATGALAETPEVTVAHVREFLGRHGAELRPGDRIIAGSMNSPHPVAMGDRLSVSFGALGSLEACF